MMETSDSATGGFVNDWNIKAICIRCGDYCYRRNPNDLGYCSTCDGGTLRLATPQECCDACVNSHRSDFVHTCGL
jgi:hypothetical protein